MKRGLHQLPIQITLAAFAFYLITGCHVITLENLAITAQLSGWQMQTSPGQPLFWLITLPLRLLPAAWIPFGLNMLSAACGALTLGLLVRCLERLPWSQKLSRLPGWQQKLPAIFGVLLCGLQLDFWQQSTLAPAETLDALLLLIPFWCLIEFRATVLERSVFDERWVYAASFGWGLGMAQNWVMMPALPLFLLALLVTHPMGLWNPPVLLRLTGWGVAGFAIYAAGPFIQMLSPGSGLGLGAAWLASLHQTKQLFIGFCLQFLWGHRMLALAVILFYLLAGLAGFMRLHDEVTFGKMRMDHLQIWLFRGLRTLVLVAFVWLALDPTIGPRAMLHQQMGLDLALLSLNLLGAFGTAFLTGELLLMRRVYRDNDPPFDPFEIRLLSWIEKVIGPLLATGMALAVIALIIRNGPALLGPEQKRLMQFGATAVKELPAEDHCIVLADSSLKLWTLQAAQSRATQKQHWLPVDLSALPNPDYRRWLEQKLPGSWLNEAPAHNLSIIEEIQLLDGLSRSNRLFYLQPGFSPIFEAFYPEPATLLAELQPYLTNAVAPPPASVDREVQAQKNWESVLTESKKILASRPRPQRPREKPFAKRLHLETRPHDQERLISEWYSMAANMRGVELQRTGQLKPAAECFELAIKLATNNWVARGNWFANTNLQSGSGGNLADLRALAGSLSHPDVLTGSLEHYGPADEASLCFLLGNVCVNNNWLRLAMQQFERATQLAPDVPAPRFALATLYARCGLPTQAGAVIAHLREQAKHSPQPDKLNIEISFSEAEVFLFQTNRSRAQGILLDVAREHLDDPAVLERALNALMRTGDLTNVMDIVTTRLAASPNDITLLLTRSGLLLRAGNPQAALPVLDHLLSLTNYPPARLNRAIAGLQLKEYAAAQRDFETLGDSAINPFTVHFGLAESALGLGNTNLAIEHLNACLTNTAAGSSQYQAASDRLRGLVK